MTISSEITNILNDLGSRFGVVIDWSSQNVVPYVQDLVSRIAKLEIVNSIGTICFGVMCLVMTVLFIKFIYKHYDDLNFDVYFGAKEVFLILGIVIFGFLGMILIPGGSSGLTKAIYLPELTAIEYVQRLMK